MFINYWFLSKINNCCNLLHKHIVEAVLQKKKYYCFYNVTLVTVDRHTCMYSYDEINRKRQVIFSIFFQILCNTYLSNTYLMNCF